MAVFGPSGASSSSAGTPTSVTNPSLSNIPIPLALTEYSFALPAGSKRFLIRSRNGGIIHLAFATGLLSTVYLTVPKGCNYQELDLAASSSVTLYFQSNIAGDIVEVVSWS